MIKREDLQQPRDAFYWVERVLEENKEYYLTKEEIYARIPRDREDVTIVTVSSLETAIRMLAHMGRISIEWANGKRHFGYCEGEHRR